MDCMHANKPCMYSKYMQKEFWEGQAGPVAYSQRDDLVQLCKFQIISIIHLF